MKAERDSRNEADRLRLQLQALRHCFPIDVLHVDSGGAIVNPDPSADHGPGAVDLATLYPGELGLRLNQAVAAGLESMESVVFEHSASANGVSSHHEIRVTPAPNGECVVILRDVSKERRVEAAWQHSVSLLQASLDSTADGLLIVDMEGRISSFNGRFVDMWRIPAEVIESRDDNRALQFVLDQLTNPGAFIDKVKELYGCPEAESYDVLEFKDGRTFERFSLPHRLGDTVVGRVWSFRDVTRRRMLEEQLIQAQKMEAVGRLAGGVAHDFNNLLTVMMGYGQILAAGFDNGAPRRENLDEILKACSRAAGLTRQLLAFSRRQAVAPRNISLNELIRDQSEMLQRMIREDIRIESHLHPELRAVRMDPAQVEQVIMNLVINAADAMPEGGTLTIETTHATPGEGDDSQAGAGEPCVALLIRDTGIGMSEETRLRAFEPFFTTKEKGKGTGLGLSIVYSIVEQNGGRITVESRPGLGTTFRILLPAAESAGSTQSAAVGSGQERETILVAEDEPSLREMVREILVECGYTVLEGRDGVHAMEVARGHTGNIDLLLTDVVMPGHSGREVAEMMNRFRPGTRVLFMSGYTDDPILNGQVRRSEIEFLGKPFSPSDLRKKVREVLDLPERMAS